MPTLLSVPWKKKNWPSFSDSQSPLPFAQCIYLNDIVVVSSSFFITSFSYTYLRRSAQRPDICLYANRLHGGSMAITFFYPQDEVFLFVHAVQERTGNDAWNGWKIRDWAMTDGGAIHRSEGQIWVRLPLGCRCFRSWTSTASPGMCRDGVTVRSYAIIFR